MIGSISMAIAAFACAAWLVLLLFRGGFWRADRRIDPSPLLSVLTAYPRVRAIVPARDEADVLPQSLDSLFQQDYPGDFAIVLIDDRSRDGTAEVARSLSEKLGRSDRLTVISGQPLAAGWSGKLWAMEQGIRTLRSQPPDYLLLTDADIAHHAGNLRELVVHAERSQLDLVSLMVKLRCDNFWERFLIPGFVFFFQKLYPFPWVNDPRRPIAAAAGGCILIRWDALMRIGGLESIRQALIDDCSLAARVKSTLPKDSNLPRGIWLGLSDLVRSLRPYDSLTSIWQMVARTAFTQLNYSPWLLSGTVLGMIVLYLAAPLAAISGLLTGNWVLALVGGSTWGLMAIAYLPTIRLYRQSWIWTLTLPAIGSLYTLMTLDSARQHWQGKGGGWKGRVYEIPERK